MRFLYVTGASLLLLTGCASTFTLQGNAPKDETTTAQEMTVNASFAREEQYINLCDDQDADVAAIRFHTNPAYLLASILSLGLYVPQHVTWWCGSEEAECAPDDPREECQVYVREDD